MEFGLHATAPMDGHATSGDAAAAAAADKDDDAVDYVTMTSFCKCRHSGA